MRRTHAHHHEQIAFQQLLDLTNRGANYYHAIEKAALHIGGDIHRLHALYQRHKALPPEARPAFLHTPEWKALRQQVFARYGRRCQACGAEEADGVSLNIDHIKNRRDWPELALEIDNLQVLCAPCNKAKGNSKDDWRDFNLATARTCAPRPAPATRDIDPRSGHGHTKPSTDTPARPDPDTTGSDPT